jgi:hypothetical protein
VNVANASPLADTLSRERDRALLFRTLATLRTDIVLFDDVDELRWKGPTPAFADLAARLDAAVAQPRRPAARRSRADSRIRSAAIIGDMKIVAAGPVSKPNSPGHVVIS